MSGLLGAVLTLGVGAALLLLTGVAVLALLRTVVAGVRGYGRLGCGLVLLLLLLWLISGLAAGTAQPAQPRPAVPSPVVE